MKCSCGRKAVYFRKYEGLHYCARCFCTSFEKKFRKTVGKYKLVQHKDRIVVGLSGGKDSSAALYLLHKMVKRRGDLTLHAVAIDEGIPGYRPATLTQARKLCKDLSVPLKVVTFKKELGSTLEKKLAHRADSPCTFCGVGRRYLLNKAARELKATKLCVGHNLDDEAQSILMNFLRGDLLRAGRMGTLTNESVGKGFIPRIKPLRFHPEKEIALYALLKKLPFSDDECPNLSGLRPQVRDWLNEMESRHTGTKFSLVDGYDKIVPSIKQSVRYKGPLIVCKKCGEPSSQDVCKTCLLWR